MMGSEPNNPFERPRIAVRDTESQSDDGLSIEIEITTQINLLSGQLLQFTNYTDGSGSLPELKYFVLSLFSTVPVIQKWGENIIISRHIIVE